MSNNKFNLRSMIVGVVVGAGLFGGVVGASTLVTGDVYFNPYPIVADGKNYTPTLQPLNYKGTTYVPLKELGKLTNTDVSFTNNTIYVKNKTNSTQSNVTFPSYTTSSIEVDEGKKTTVPVNLAKYGATTATASVSDHILELSQSFFSTSGNITVKGTQAGTAVLSIKYNTGNIEYITVKINEEIVEEDIEVGVNKYKNVYIDLEDFDADEAEFFIESGKSYVSINKDKITTSGNLKITGKKEGEAVIRVEYDSGEESYINVEVTEADSDEADLEIVKGENKNVYIDLDDYDADSATIKITSGSTYIGINKTSMSSSGNLKITGKKIGNGTIKITFDTGDTVILYVEVEDDVADYDDYDYVEEYEIEIDEEVDIYVDLEYNDADSADISIKAGSSFVSLEKTSVSASRDVAVRGLKAGNAIILIEYDTGDKEYFWIEVEEDSVDYDDYDYEDEISITEGSYEYIYIDLEEYDADSADITVLSGKSYVTASRVSISESMNLKLTGKAEGKAIILVEYDSGDDVYYLVEVDD